MWYQREPLLLKHLEAVLAYNQSVNLTSIKDIETGKVLHIQDSLAVLPEVLAAPVGRMADLGSGAGYPGIPLALCTKRKTTLIESTQKKAIFLQSFIDANALRQLIEVAGVRSEELALEQSESYSLITARAVAELPVLLELATPLLAKGGHFLALKGQPDAAELERGALAASRLGLEVLCKRQYQLPGNKNQRTLITYVKVSTPTIKLPRRPGVASKHPLA